MQQWWRGGRVIREHYNLLVVGDESSMKMTVGMEGMGRHVWTRRRMARHCIEHDGTTHDCEATSDAGRQALRKERTRRTTSFDSW
mmetsp:Transcript_17720/g.47860  ORF Transcript_17720/g.47860 Transcript_17720/m.47860 type:complete len:85 (-) Transcript_17720:1485-1739(-)|eukprot:7391732-Prymnesium_polylepis.5